jgi:uncharacterized protein YfiM (DUF2279 family)
MLLLLRLFFGLLGLALVAIPAGLIALAVMVPQAQPLVASATEPTPAAVSRARALFQRHDPRRLPVGGQGRLRLTQEEVDLALAALPRRLQARVEIAGGSATVQGTLELPPNPLGPYLNLSTEVTSEGAGLVPQHLHLGPVAVPDMLAGWVAELAWKQLLEHPEWGPVARTVEEVRLENDALAVSYRVAAKLPEQLRGLAVAPAELNALRAYHGILAQSLAAGHGALPLPRLLAPLFQLAEERGGGADEYQAALLVIGVPLAGKSLSALVPEARAWPALPRRAVTLRGRTDSAQHFVVSALLAAHAGTPVSKAVGLWKELEDSRGGSGFSFADLAADLAGTRVGEALVGPGGLRLAQQLARGASEESLVPQLADLPENLDQTTFRARYGGPGDPRYEGLQREIARRVAALTLRPAGP